VLSAKVSLQTPETLPPPVSDRSLKLPSTRSGRVPTRVGQRPCRAQVHRAADAALDLRGFGGLHHVRTEDGFGGQHVEGELAAVAIGGEDAARSA
jgi:hypothetical protein